VAVYEALGLNVVLAPWQGRNIAPVQVLAVAMSVSPRGAISLLVLAGSLCASPALAQTAGGGSGPSTPGAAGSASASLVACQVAVDQADRSATFAGQMQATTTSASMEMRIDLLERAAAGSGFAPVSAPGLGVWRQSAPGVTIYRYVREVTNLPAPARYRASFGYRWLDAGHRVVRRATRLTPICVQPDERPLLSVAAVTISPSPSSLDAQYSITLRNAGHSPAGPFDVELTVNAMPQPEIVVQSLGAGTSTVLPVTALRCAPSSHVVVTIDPQGAVNEAPGGGLPKTVACPLAAASRASR
jgi:hypothetical protein